MSSPEGAPPGRVIAFDPGERRIGVAASDEGRRLATPRKAIDERDPARALAAAADRVREEGATRIVVGLPRNMDGTEGRAARAARDFAKALERRTGVPAEMQDERLTTDEAEEILREAGVPPRRRKPLRDSLAAQRILTAWLDARADPD